MANRDPQLEHLERLLRLYKRGAVTAIEIANWCIATANNAIAAQIVRTLPAEILKRVRQQLEHAPTSEAEWLECDVISIRGGSEPHGGINLDRPERVARYRASIEAWRAVLSDMPG